MKHETFPLLLTQESVAAVLGKETHVSHYQSVTHFDKGPKAFHQDSVAITLKQIQSLVLCESGEIELTLQVYAQLYEYKPCILIPMLG